MLAQAAVVGRPDERWGAVGVAYVVLERGHSACAGELVDFCRAELAGFKVPREVHVVVELPRSAMGKILRRKLRTADEEAMG